MSTVLTTNTPGAATDASVQAITTKLGTTLLVDNSAHTQPVSGSVTANLGTLNGAATDASVQAVTTKLGTTLLVDASAHIQPVSGTVTANLGTIAGVMTDVTGQSILTAIQNQRAVIPYTDDTNAFYLLQIKNGTATWTDAAITRSRRPRQPDFAQPTASMSSATVRLSRLHPAAPAMSAEIFSTTSSPTIRLLAPRSVSSGRT